MLFFQSYNLIIYEIFYEEDNGYSEREYYNNDDIENRVDSICSLYFLVKQDCDDIQISYCECYDTYNYLKRTFAKEE